MTRFLLATLLAGTASLGWAGEGHDHDDHPDEAEAHAFALDDFVVEHAWTRATRDGTAFVFMLLHNLGDAPVTLEGATAEIAETADLVGFTLQDGQQTAVPLPQVPVPAGREMELEPGVMAVRLDGLTAVLEQGGHLEMVLRTSLGELPVKAEIGARDASQHSHAGHSHLGEVHGHDHAEEDDHDHAGH